MYAKRCLLLGYVVLLAFGCSHQATSDVLRDTQRLAMSNTATPSVPTTYLVFKVSSACEDEVPSDPRSHSACFLLPWNGGELHAEEVFSRGLFFTKLGRLVAYAEEHRFTNDLDFHATVHLVGDPMPFEDFSSKALESPKCDDGTGPDMLANIDESGFFVSRFRKGPSALLYHGPSGAALDEYWALSFGRLIRDYEQFKKERREKQLHLPIEMRVMGKALE